MKTITVGTSMVLVAKAFEVVKSVVVVVTVAVLVLLVEVVVSFCKEKVALEEKIGEEDFIEEDNRDFLNVLE